MITGIILASGFSNRFNSDKLLFKISEKSTIEHVINNCFNSLLDEIIIVYRNEEIKMIATRYNIKSVKNLFASEGMASSIRLGVLNANTITDAYMVIMGDQPLFDSKDINKMIKLNNGHSIIAATYDGLRKTPVIFPKRYYNDLLNIHGDEGGRNILNCDKNEKKLVEYSIEKSFDLDNIEDIDKIKKFITGDKDV